MSELLPSLEGNIRAEIEAHLPRLSPAFAAQVATLGLVSSSLSESWNKLMSGRDAGPTQSLWLVRKSATFIMSLAQLNRCDRISRARHPVDDKFGVPLTPWLRRTLERLLDKGRDWDIEDLGDGTYRATRGEKWYILTPLLCPCGFMTEMKLMCKHLLRLYEVAGADFPPFLLSGRWLPTDVEPPTFPADLELHLQDLVVASHAQSDADETEQFSSDEEPAQFDGGTGNDTARYK